jgi:hypothetical protein
MCPPDADADAAEKFVRNLAETGDPRAFMDAHTHELTPGLAKGVRTLAVQALQAGAFDYASFAGNAAGSMNIRIGNRAEALACRLLALQGDFHKATTVKDYEAVREEFLETEERAGTVEGTEQVRFEARGFAVQCGYFACEAAASPEPAESLIQRSLEDVLALLEQEASPIQRVELFMDFVFPTLDLATARVWLDNSGAIEDALHRIAGALETAIPAEAPLSVDPSRDAAMADVLARLAARHGG